MVRQARCGRADRLGRRGRERVDVDDGILRPDVSAVFPMADAHEAFLAKATKHIPGKVVLTVS